jgi:hypothetical protein
MNDSTFFFSKKIQHWLKQLLEVGKVESSLWYINVHFHIWTNSTKITLCNKFWVASCYGNENMYT